MPLLRIQTLSNYFPAAVCGLLLTASFPDITFSWFAWVALVPLLVHLNEISDSARAFKTGLVAGMVHFTTLLYWIVPTIHRFGGIPLILAIPVLLFLCCYLACYPAVFTWLMVRFNSRPLTLPLRAAFLWSALEYLRSIFLTGFPWGLLGSSQYANTTLIQVADVTGVYGISFLLVLSNGIIAWMVISVRKARRINTHLPLRFIFMWTLVFQAVLASVLVYGTVRIKAIEQQIDQAATMNIGIVQGNINQAHKWEESWQTMTVERYCNLSLDLAGPRPDLIVWPETAMPFYYSWDRELSDTVDRCVRERGTSFLFGSPAFEGDETNYRIFNRAYMVNRFGIITGTYDKQHLVPFGEYVPFGKILTFLGKLTVQAGDFSPGPENPIPLNFNVSSAGILICFEAIFSPLARNRVANGAGLLVTLTNDAWFGRTSAPFQHFSVCVFRAIETRRALARAANTGISGFIDPVGRRIGQTHLFKAAALSATLPILTSTSVYIRVGDLFAMFCIIASLIGCRVNRRPMPGSDRSAKPE